MRRLVKMFDLDDCRWMMIVILGVMCAYSLDAGWRAQDAAAKVQRQVWDNETTQGVLAARVDQLEARPVPAPVQMPIDLPPFKPGITLTTSDAVYRFVQ